MSLESPSQSNGGKDSIPPFEEECRRTLQGVRLALIESFAEAEVDASRPRHAARQLELDKSLVWRISKIVAQPDVFREVGNMPHRAGMGILRRAFQEAGVSAETVQRLGAAHELFEELVVRHAGDRATFEVVARGLGSTASQGSSLEQDRKLAFRANSALWSAQAGVQVTVAILAPNADDPSMVDVVHLFGLVDLRRLRTDVRWTLSRRRIFDDDSSAERRAEGEALDPSADNGAFSLIREFSSEPFPELIIEDLGNELQCSLPEGPVGRTGELTAMFGFRYRALGSQVASETDRYSQMISKLLTPAEQLHFDMLVHEDLALPMPPKVAIHGTLDGRGYHMGCGREGFALPFSETVVELGSGLAGAATPRMPWYGALLEWAYQRADWDPARFRGYRFEMAYPPVPADAILYSELLPPADD
jgi:hypothetical protein